MKGAKPTNLIGRTMIPLIGVDSSCLQRTTVRGFLCSDYVQVRPAASFHLCKIMGLAHAKPIPEEDVLACSRGRQHRIVKSRPPANSRGPRAIPATNIGETSVKHWQKIGQKLVKLRSNTGQTLVEYWSNTDQKLVKHWSNSRGPRAETGEGGGGAEGR